MIYQITIATMDQRGEFCTAVVVSEKVTAGNDKEALQLLHASLTTGKNKPKNASS